MSKIVTVFCAGLIGWDSIGRTKKIFEEGDDLPGSIETRIGGVIANIAIALSKNCHETLNFEIVILSSTGKDERSDELISLLSETKKVNCDYVIRNPGSTDSYLAIESKNGLFGAIAASCQLEKSCLEILRPLLNTDLIKKLSTNYFIVDTNLTTQTIDYLTINSAFDKTQFIIACASPFKAKKIRVLMIKRHCIIYANLAEAAEILETKPTCSSEAAELLFSLGAKQAIVTNGQHKVSIRTKVGLATYTPTKTETSKVTGAGDTFLAVHFLSKLTNKNLSEQEHLEIATDAAYHKINCS